MVKVEVKSGNAKAWYQSRAAWGGLLTAGAGVLAAVGSYLTGQLDLATMINQVLPMIGIGLGIIGIRFKKD